MKKIAMALLVLSVLTGLASAQGSVATMEIETETGNEATVIVNPPVIVSVETDGDNIGGINDGTGNVEVEVPPVIGAGSGGSGTGSGSSGISGPGVISVAIPDLSDDEGSAVVSVVSNDNLVAEIIESGDAVCYGGSCETVIIDDNSDVGTCEYPGHPPCTGTNPPEVWIPENPPELSPPDVWVPAFPDTDMWITDAWSWFQWR